MIRAILVSVASLLVMTSAGHAEDASPLEPTPWESFRRGKGYVRVPDPPVAESIAHFSNVIFLNRCVGGCTIVPGNDNSSASPDRSSVIGGTVQLSAFRWGDEVWNEVVSCVQEVFSPFDVVVTDVDPGSAEHMEAMVAGTGAQVGGEPGLLGFAPFACGYIPRSVSFTLANENYYGAGSQTRDVNELCSTIAQEVAHTWGLDHEILNRDPMTYAAYNGRRYFQDELVQCGEYPQQQHPCGCGGQMQNSVAEITAVFGTGTPTPPHVTILDPEDGAQVEPGFPVHGEADETLSKMELRINGTVVQTITTPPYAFNAPDDLGEGGHRVELRAFDLQNTPGSAFVDVVIGEPCETPGDCAGAGENYTCVGGRCVPGEGAPGGLGSDCTEDSQCYSGLCLTSGTESHCVEQCNPEGDDCPGGFDCLGFEGGGVCWPGDGGGGGGCASGNGSGNALPIGLGLAFAGLVARRRRRR
jgi:hypothetical protein